MHSHCATSQCSKPILPLREGRLFLVETGPVAEPTPSCPGRSGKGLQAVAATTKTLPLVTTIAKPGQQS
jgi:hypothetical protein